MKKQALAQGDDSASVSTGAASATLRNSCSFTVIYKSTFLKLDTYNL